MSEPIAEVRVEDTAELGLVDTVHDAVERLWVAVPEVSDDDRMLFALAVSELVTNMVEHAQGMSPPHVSVHLSVDESALTAVLADDADPALIRLDDVHMPDADAESGRGLALALAALDELAHEPGEGNVWRLRRLRRDDSPPL
ncbi:MULTISPECIES: ATP-binding protein [unclassified Microbacterium]|uniref:ATP-binding protein n=1 Tax=unclassified Microbacterium TaxID=2609290 RepID=UPI00386471A5